MFSQLLPFPCISPILLSYSLHRGQRGFHEITKNKRTLIPEQETMAQAGRKPTAAHPTEGSASVYPLEPQDQTGGLMALWYLQPASLAFRGDATSSCPGSLALTLRFAGSCQSCVWLVWNTPQSWPGPLPQPAVLTQFRVGLVRNRLKREGRNDWDTKSPFNPNGPLCGLGGSRSLGKQQRRDLGVAGNNPPDQSGLEML